MIFRELNELLHYATHAYLDPLSALGRIKKKLSLRAALSTHLEQKDRVGSHALNNLGVKYKREPLIKAMHTESASDFSDENLIGEGTALTIFQCFMSLIQYQKGNKHISFRRWSQTRSKYLEGEAGTLNNSATLRRVRSYESLSSIFRCLGSFSRHTSADAEGIALNTSCCDETLYVRQRQLNLGQALAIYRRIKDLGGEGTTLSNLGIVQ